MKRPMTSATNLRHQPTTADRARARFAHKVDRQWQKGPPAPMPKHWRLACDVAVAMAPALSGDPIFHRAMVASLRFATPRMRGQWSAIDVWASDPVNVATLALDLLPVIRTHAARGSR